MEYINVTYLPNKLSKMISIIKYNDIEIYNIIMFYLKDGRYQINYIKDINELDKWIYSRQTVWITKYI